MSSRYHLLCLLLFAALLRGGVLWVMWENLNEDRDAYREIAENLATYRIYGLGKNGEQPRPTAYRPPLYPVLLAKLAGEGLEVTPLRVALLHWALGIWTVGLTWVTARIFCQDSDATGKPTSIWRPSLAALLVACDPILLNWSTYVMTETLATFLAILALYTLIRFHLDRRPMNAVFAGCALGLAVLCRPTFLPWAGLCGVALLFLQASAWRQPPGTKTTANQSLIAQYARRFANLAAFGIVAAVVVIPWGYRNYQQFGKPIITTTHGGYTFFLANNDLYYDYLATNRSSVPWSSESFDIQFRKRYEFDLLIEAITHPQSTILGESTTALSINVNDPPLEILVDEGAYKQAWSAIHSRPLMFAYSCLYRFGQLWSPLPHKLTTDESSQRALLRYAICAWYLVVFAAALVGVWQLREKLLRSPWVWGVLLCLVFTGVHTFYWSNLRMRAPLMPFVAILAGAGGYSLANRLRRESHTEARRHRAEKK